MVAQIIKSQIERIEYREKMIFWTLFGLLVMLGLSYGFLVERSIENAVAKQGLESQMSSLNEQVGTLESSYLALEDAITMDLAKTKGFVAVPENVFAVAEPAEKVAALSVNEN
ncbi:MAG: hypothetical protein KGH93_02330 [Patescibacteria group bacterium]|nr:hypothetical protein [Patescibacteria group bacterium]MDE1946014.1 hypothetical protein [Patescibacteria group bacterium]